MQRDQLQHLDKQVILADQLSATEREDEERETEDFVESALVSILSRLNGQFSLQIPFITQYLRQNKVENIG